MTLRGRLMAFYPAFILGLALADVLWFGYRPSVWAPVLFLAIIYVIPPVSLRLHQWLCPLKEGRSNLSKPGYSAWWGLHQIQVLYTAVPQLEAVLRIVPGLYSAWLRLCGSRVGRRVYWTPNIEITDRSMVEIGDGVLFGHKCKLLGHAIKPKGAVMMLYIRKIKIGDNVFVGAGSRIGPGARIVDGVYLPVLTDVHINKTVEATPATKEEAKVF